MRELELHPDETVIFEDSDTGMEAALATGSETVKVIAHHEKLQNQTNSREFVSTDNFYWLIRDQNQNIRL